MINILITSMGGPGSNNLVETLRMIDAERFNVIGTHSDVLELARADIESLFVVPPASEENAYIDAHLKVIDACDVDILITNSDAEVRTWSPRRDEIPCKHLVPPLDLVTLVQDKLTFHQTLTKHGCPTVPSIPVGTREGIADAVAALPDPNRFWIRRRIGSGSLGATWLTSASQAEKWVDLWTEVRGFEVNEFIVAPFLEGRDFCVTTIWQNGEFCVGKIYERLSYMQGGATLSGMGSGPKSARTPDDTEPIVRTREAIQAVYDEFGLKPHGLYQCDLKCDDHGNSYVTELNIGRFPQTSTHFDRVGQYCLLELYLKLLLKPDEVLPRDVFDLDPDKLFLRRVDGTLRIVPQSRISELEARTP
ncbi:MAG: hypothetical protein CL569_16425 [Alphaproteobacteria bacterium]|nr:hypothetical protein [Alphaproteobacteria bacterium]|tara:strand:- start:1062 stop:2150 length:1089 start_codon:yes stop_codon:yes gene_type:complete